MFGSHRGFYRMVIKLFPILKKEMSQTRTSQDIDLEAEIFIPRYISNKDKNIYGRRVLFPFPLIIISQNGPEWLGHGSNETAVDHTIRRSQIPTLGSQGQKDLKTWQKVQIAPFSCCPFDRLHQNAKMDSIVRACLLWL